MTASHYQAGPLRRYRRSPAELETLQAALYQYAGRYQPVTVRQLFYAMSVQGLAPKTETGYDLIGRELVKMREAGRLPFHWIADNTRLSRRPATWSGIEEMLEITAQTYRRSLWLDSPAYVEVWLEKDALSGVLYQETARYDVALMVTRGYSSVTFLHNAARDMAQVGRPVFIYYFGDHDPSDLNIPVKVEATLRRYAPEADIHFERVAVNPDQIQAWNLPTRPTKAADSRAKSFKGESVEVDAISPDQLRALARGRIERHLDPHRLEQMQLQENMEREQLTQIAAVTRKWRGGPS